jgi:quinol monooxygenase YgiN
MTPLSRAEPGCLMYVAQVSTQDPTRFLLYEQYRSAQAYEDHKASAHFQRHVVGTAIPLMESREVTTWETLEP